MLIDSFPKPDDWCSIERITAGWSREEEKHHVTTESALQSARLVLEWYDGFNTVMPSWYAR